MINVQAKDPNAIDDFTWRWNLTWLGSATISGFTATVVQGGVTVVSTSITQPNLTTARVSGGTPGIYAKVKGTITLNDGRTDDETLIFLIKDQ